MSAEVKYAGRYIEAVKDGRWEYVRRAGGMNAVVIEAEVDGRLLLVEQFRVPIGRNALELPAGLVGDDDGGEEDTVIAAAHRELEEETGYRAERIEVVGTFYSSPGMLAESFTAVRAHGLTKIGEGGGVGNEDIVVHHVARADIPAFVAIKRAKGVAIDVRVMAYLD